MTERQKVNCEECKNKHLESKDIWLCNKYHRFATGIGFCSQFEKIEKGTNNMSETEKKAEIINVVTAVVSAVYLVIKFIREFKK